MFFRDNYDYLSNMYPSSITLKLYGSEYTFLCAESAFQAMKCKNPKDVSLFTNIWGGEAKRLGRTIDLRDDWENKKVEAMAYVTHQKYRQNPRLEKKLLQIKETIVEDNDWGDKFWGVCNGEGQNMMGQILESYQRVYHVNKKTDMRMSFTGKRPKDIYGYEKEKYYPLVELIKKAVLYNMRFGFTKFITGGAQGFDSLVFWAINAIIRDTFFLNKNNIENIVYVPFYGQEKRWNEKGFFGQQEYRLMLQIATKVLYLAWNVNSTDIIRKQHPYLNPASIPIYRNMSKYVDAETVPIIINGQERYLQVKRDYNGDLFYATVGSIKEITVALMDRNRAMVNDSNKTLGLIKDYSFLLPDSVGGTENCLRYAMSKDREIAIMSPETLLYGEYPYK